MMIVHNSLVFLILLLACCLIPNYCARAEDHSNATSSSSAEFSTNSSESLSEEGGGSRAADDQTPLIVGLVVGGLALISILSGAIVLLLCCKKRKAGNDEGEERETEPATLTTPSTQSIYYDNTQPTATTTSENSNSQNTVPISVLTSHATESATLKAMRNNHNVVGWVNEAEPPLGTTSNRVGAGALVVAGSMAFNEEENIVEREMIHAGEFRKIKLVGRGSFGSVYSVLLDNGRTIAMKEIMLSQESFEEQVKEVQREMEVMREVHHSNIVQYYTAECDAIEYTLRVFMEYVTGGSLGFMARQTEGALGEVLVKGFVAQALTGLAHIHRQGIVHRDIKADNMLLGADGHVKLADFGTARSVQGTNRGAQTMIGTPYFMAPELLVERDTGEIEYGMKADVWSMGITVCELLNQGLPPWPPFNNPGQAFLHIASDHLPIVPQGCSDLAKSFILRACNRNAKERPTSAELLDHEWLRDAWTTHGAVAIGDNTSGATPRQLAFPIVESTR